jgi:hypothetical protein
MFNTMKDRRMNPTRNPLFERILSRQAQEALEHELRREKAMEKIRQMREVLRKNSQKELA